MKITAGNVKAVFESAGFNCDGYKVIDSELRWSFSSGKTKFKVVPASAIDGLSVFMTGGASIFFDYVEICDCYIAMHRESVIVATQQYEA